MVAADWHAPAAAPCQLSLEPVVCTCRGLAVASECTCRGHSVLEKIDASTTLRGACVWQVCATLLMIVACICLWCGAVVSAAFPDAPASLPLGVGHA